jgi:thiamine monophosphate kinase
VLALGNVTRIGKITEGSSVTVLDKTGATIALAHKGYRHF